jgi:hypothetical protein
VVLPLSSAQVCVAPSIHRRLLTQALLAGVFHAQIKLGRTMAATTATSPTAPTAIIDFFDMCLA